MMRWRAQAGFTLLELVFAMVLSAAVALLAAQSLATATDFFDRSRSRLAFREDLRSVRHLLRSEWRGRLWLQLTPTEALFETTRPSLTVTEGSARIVRYRCVAGKDGLFRLMYALLASDPRPVRPGGARGGGRGEGSPQSTPASLAQQGAPREIRVVQETELLNGLSRCGFSVRTSVNPAMVSDRKVTLIGQWRTAWSREEAPPVLLRGALSAPGGDIPDLVVVHGES